MTGSDEEEDVPGLRSEESGDEHPWPRQYPLAADIRFGAGNGPGRIDYVTEYTTRGSAHLNYLAYFAPYLGDTEVLGMLTMRFTTI